MAFSIELELADGGIVTYDNVVAYTVEENPDEIPEEGDEEREGNEEPDLSESEKAQENPMMEEEEEVENSN